VIGMRLAKTAVNASAVTGDSSVCRSPFSFFSQEVTRSNRKDHCPVDAVIASRLMTSAAPCASLQMSYECSVAQIFSLDSASRLL
jgi:hypothetical protein